MKFNPLPALIIAGKFAKKIEEMHLPTVLGADSLVCNITRTRLTDKNCVAGKGIGE